MDWFSFHFPEGVGEYQAVLDQLEADNLSAWASWLISNLGAEFSGPAGGVVNKCELNIKRVSVILKKGNQDYISITLDTELGGFEPTLIMRAPEGYGEQWVRDVLQLNPEIIHD